MWPQTYTIPVLTMSYLTPVRNEFNLLTNKERIVLFALVVQLFMVNRTFQYIEYLENGLK